MDAHEKISNYMSFLTEALAMIDQEAIASIVDRLQKVKTARGFVWTIGNGGSAATASHLANDLRKACNIPTISLPDQTATVTAYGNDNGWVNMYSHAIHLFLRPVDVLVAISCSGRSANVVEAARMVNKDRLVVLTGNPDPFNTLATLASGCIVYAQSKDIKVQETLHLAICHSIVAALTEQP